MARGPEAILEEWLVVEAQRGRTAALQALAVRWHPRLVGHAYRRTGHPDAAAEVAQEAWIAIIRGLTGLEDPAAFRVWAFRIVDRKSFDWIRRRRRGRALANRLVADASLHDPDCDPGPEARPREGDGRDERIEQLRLALRRLPDDSRIVLTMLYVDGLSVIEIAGALRLPEGTVKSRLFHARKQLRDSFEAQS
ncbi:RNA polymerase sigma factor [Aquisphaera insulae]|uniref:RNA polymerase sigma factor n=1 Tax=Aquisphaera insulae TaxID=2712864 RepID=UPI0013E9A398|nr:RNA polymerase sigma factor [Aquisphaera insulae]